jgi:phosphopantothenoylcysteine decarboxylase/phosphopantothenate--cysteine ligase
VSARLTIVVGVTGGIAAYKAVGVIRALVLEGHSVHVVATEAALRFVGRPTLEAISRNPVATDLYEGVAEVRHVAIGQSADLIVIAPATANTIAKLAVGLADDLLGNTVLASTAPLVIAPAMHTEMWQNPATVANIATLRERGVTIVGPAIGQLTGKDSGPGRMEEPETIVRAALAVVGGGAAEADAALVLPQHPPPYNRQLSSRSPSVAERANSFGRREAETTSRADASSSARAAHESPSTRSGSSATARAGARASRSQSRRKHAAPRSPSSLRTSRFRRPTGCASSRWGRPTSCRTPSPKPHATPTSS